MNLKQYIRKPNLGLKRFGEYVVDQSVRINIAKGSYDYQKYLILGYYRTGSNLLVSLLRSHPKILAFSEIFSPRGIYWADAVHGKSMYDATLINKRDTFPIQFLEEDVFRKFSSKIEAVGFKYLYPQMEMEVYSEVNDFIRNNPDIKIIHLKRHDFLEVFCSLQYMKQTKAAVGIDPKTVDKAAAKSEPIHVDFQVCKEFFEILERRIHACEEMTRAHDVFNISYSEIKQNPTSVLKRAHTFLGVEEADVFSPLKKLNPFKPSELIQNYEEIAEGFSGTKWEKFFN